MSARERIPRAEPARSDMHRGPSASSAHGHAHAPHAQREVAHSHSPFESSALAGGLGARLAVAAVAVALLWLTIGWALA